ncbi:MAG: tetratricopeptide repeat protein, partial [Bacteroidota bacterium]
KRKYIKTIRWYDRVDLNVLSPSQELDYNFKRGYSHFKLEELDASKKYFSMVIQEPNKYEVPANYYFGHIAYQEGKYETAMNSFDKIKDQEKFKGLVPVYISQIYFQQENFQELVDYAPGIIELIKEERQPEVLRMIGESYFRLENYERAAEYLEQFASSSGFKDREGYYELGYSYYRIGKYPSSIEAFTKVTFEEDSLSQLTAYQLADAYLKNGDKLKARNGFKQAANYSFDRELQEDALFNFAKLAYELSADPFDEAIQAFETYLEEYPNSERSDQAYEFLLNVYLTTKNYEAAYNALNKLQELDFREKEIYQTVVFNRGIEFIKSKKFELANEFLDKVTNHPIDESINGKAKFWKAEILYKQQKFEQAVLAYKAFLVHPGSLKSGYSNSANYSLGYTYFNQKEFASSRDYFKKFISKYSAKNKKKLNDAYLRLADSHFVQKDYALAIESYNKAREVGIFDKDYALFQISRCNGYSNDLDAKIENLMKLLNENAESPYVAAAKFEIGDSYFKKDANDQALNYLNDVIDNHASSAYIKRSLKTLGLIYYRDGEFEESMAAFKRVIEDFANDADSKEALDRLKDIAVETGNTDILDNLDFDISSAALDSVAYRSAENMYIDGNCEGARPAFEAYLKKYQPGIFGLNANFYKAECDYEAEDFDAALRGYEFAISQTKNQFTEPSLLAAASITYKRLDYQEALDHYINLERNSEYNINILEAKIGQMRCYYYLGQLQNAKDYVDWVKDDPQTPEEIAAEAYFFEGKILYDQGQLNEAITAFQKAADRSDRELGAEAMFNKCKALYDSGKFTETEDDIFNLIDAYPSQMKWKIESFFLLSDVYVAMNDLFQAKSTLQSIIDNVEDEDVQERALKEYEEILALEKARDEGEENESEIIIEE